MKLQIHYPHRPYLISQKWGNPNPAYASQFNDTNFKLHNGIDSNIGKKNSLGDIVTEYPVWCPVEGFRVSSVRYEPNGGGNELWLKSLNKLEINGRECYASIGLCHAKKIFVKAGDTPKLGELLMIADSTGFSTGLHTHMGLYRLDDSGRKMDVNEATGSSDPAPFFTGAFAVDKSTAQTLAISIGRYFRYIMGF